MGRVKVKGYRVVVLLSLCMISSQLLGGCKRSGAGDIKETAPAAINPSAISTPINRTSNQRKLVSRHITKEEFQYSVNNPRDYEADGIIKAGIIPHHTVGATLISGFFKLTAQNADAYDTVVIVSPNHDGDLGDVVLSGCDWDVGSGISCDTEIVERVLALKVNDTHIIENHERMEDDHSASVLMPYIKHYLPEAKVVPILVSRTLTLDNTTGFAKALSKIIKESNRRVLVICSIDFSHYLTPAASKQNDKITIEAIKMKDYKKIHDFSNGYADSPATLIIFLQYLSGLELSAQILDNTDASEFLGAGVPDTTSYFVMVGCEG